jgi:hypothetical protein
MNERSTMKSVITSAIVAALIAGPAGAVAATQLNGHAIAKHSIPSNRLTAKAVKTFTAQKVSTPAPRALAAAVTSTIDYEQSTATLVSSPQTFSVACPAGDVAIGGGYQTSDDVVSGGATENSVTPNFNGWTVTVGNIASRNDGSTPTLTVYVSCEPGA